MRDGWGWFERLKWNLNFAISQQIYTASVREEWRNIINFDCYFVFMSIFFFFFLLLPHSFISLTGWCLFIFLSHSFAHLAMSKWCRNFHIVNLWLSLLLLAVSIHWNQREFLRKKSLCSTWDDGYRRQISIAEIDWDDFHVISFERDLKWNWRMFWWKILQYFKALSLTLEIIFNFYSLKAHKKYKNHFL